MLDLARELTRWCQDGKAFAVATVVAVHGSAPRLPGAALAVDEDGTAIGSVSGGCVEAAVYDLCRTALTDGVPRLERFGYSDEDAFAVGLTCGGVIDILVAPVRADAPERPVLAAALATAARGEGAALARVVEGPPALLGRPLYVRPDGTRTGTLGGPAALDRAAARETAALLDLGHTGTVEVTYDATNANNDNGARCGEEHATLLVESSQPPPRMIVFGAVDFAAALVGVGKFLGYHVTVCDARPVFATAGRFPGADEVVVDWPHRYLDSQSLDHRAVLCVLTHDPKFDIPLLTRALRLPVAYVGAMGSRRTHEDRLRRLREAGVGERELDRLRSPIGLDLGARTPEETALSIAAEIVAARRGGTGVPLTGAHTPIHHDVQAA
ncbi:XdhC/CoxI family protein [Streptomyces sp. UNOC14_S4]|uniref:XdhC family protein n=1 Tax=Streptomyces sp. UNOC14_S4 TaxID=2872340 RepID=UPI001E57B092|nr:XdhC/CoxI family protein [Streptomyces sp. UNOC14_S4]MCC3769940.1 XdhC family protein [Streptomyces sp. UNOC14_S4]